MKKALQSPFCAVRFILVALALYYGFSYLFRWQFGVFDIEKVGVTEVTTYLFYGVGAGVAFMLRNDFWGTPHQKPFLACCFVYLAAMFREMGLQHWLTRHDTTAIKIRFFTNPNNPLYEKVYTFLLLLLFVAVLVYLVKKFWKPVWRGLFRGEPLCWTILTFGLLVTITQVADRFPDNYRRMFGHVPAEPFLFPLKILEEGGESLFPLVFAIGMLQLHQWLKEHGEIPQDWDVI